MSSVKKNFIYNSIYHLLMISIPLITTPYLSRILGADSIGRYSYAYSIGYYYTIFIMLGLNNYGNREIAKVRDDKEKLSKVFWSIYWLQLSLGIVVNIIYLIYVFVVSKDTTISLLMGIYTLSACFDINWFFFGMEKFKLTVTRNIIIKIITTGLIFLCVKSQKDIVPYTLIMTVSILASQVVLWPYLFKEVVRYKPKGNEILRHIKPNLFLFLTVLAVSLYKTMDKIMLGVISSKEQVGFYESAEKIISIPMALITSLGTVMLPYMSNLAVKNKIKGQEVLSKSIIMAMFLSSAMCFGIMGISKDFVPLFYGQGFDICIQLYLILLPSCLFLAFSNVIRTQFLLPNQYDKILLSAVFCGAIINIIANTILIPKLQARGAAWGTLLAEAVVCIYQSYKIRKDIPVRKYVFQSVPFILAGIAMFVILYNIEIVQISRLVNIMVKIVIGAGIYCLICVLVKFTAQLWILSIDNKIS